MIDDIKTPALDSQSRQRELCRTERYYLSAERGEGPSMTATTIARNDSPLLRDDLPSLASHAAVELDDLILGRPKTLGAVEQLATAMSDLLAALDASQVTTWVDPRTMVVVGRAINDSGLAKAVTVDDLRQEAEVLSKQLLSLTDPRSSAPPTDDLAKIRDFCLKLSKLALASRGTGQEYRQQHPLRR